MPLIPTQLEKLVEWCATCDELADVRLEARRVFFDTANPTPIDYWPGTGTERSRQRRFLGWFMLSFRLADGTQPAEVAVEHLLESESLAAARRAIRGARFVTARVADVTAGRGARLQLEDERFDVRSRTWGRELRAGGTVITHLIPVSERVWLPGPGWLELPVEIGPGLMRELKGSFQPDPCELERILQGRSSTQDRLPPRVPPSETLDEAVVSMTEAATVDGRGGLILSVEEWRCLVLKFMADGAIAPFFRRVIELAGPVDDVQDFNRWLDLAGNIWNATPQPDRGGRTAYELRLGE